MTEHTENRKMKTAEVLQLVKADMKAADVLRSEIVGRVEKWRQEYDGKPYGNEVEGKSQIVSRDIKRQDVWQHSSVKDPFVSNRDIITCDPVTHEDRKAAEQNQLVLNYQFTRQFNRYNFMSNSIRSFYRDGTIIAKAGWEYEDEEVEVTMPRMALNEMGIPYVAEQVTVKQLNILVNKPTVELCRLEDVYIDPTCMGDLSKAQFVIHRYESDMSTLRQDGKYKNLNKLTKVVAGGDTETDGDSDYESPDTTQFRFNDTARKKFMVYEYWGMVDVNGDGIAEPIVCVWAKDVVIRLQENPYPDKEHPFLLTTNDPEPFKIYGEAYAEMIGDNQKITTAIKRGIIDNMASSNNAQKGIRVGALSATNRRRFLQGKNFEFNGSANDFYEGSYNQLPSSVFDVLGLMNNETESMVGVKAFSGGINGSAMGSTARAAGGVLDAVSVRRSDIVRNIAENLIKPLMRKWMSYNSEFLQEEEVIRITNEEFVDIKRDDLKGNVDIHVEVSTAEDNTAKAQELSFLLQTLGQNMDIQMRNMLMGQIAKLHRMPDLGKALESFQPQPDPYEERMKELTMKKLEAEIFERMSRATENETDIEAKQAKANLDRAKARELGSNADLKDLDFTRKADGTELREELAKKEFDRNTVAAKTIEDNLTKEAIARQKGALTRQ